MSNTSGGLHSLATIIKRLEAATSRLEDVTSEHVKIFGARNEASSDGANQTVDGQDNQAPPPPPPPALAEDPVSVVAFEETVVNGKLKAFITLTEGLGQPVLIEHVKLIEKEFNNLHAFLRIVGSCQKPDMKQFGVLLEPLQKDISDVTHFVETHRKERDLFNHFQVLSSGAPVAGWVALESKPAPYVEEIKNSMQFYGNQVMKAYKEKDAKHVEWVRAFTALLEQTRAYVQEYHTTGLAWNTKGIPVAQFSASKTSTVAPPPPPPPPPPGPPPPAATSASSGGGVAAVFEQLNRGEDVTKGLRKVDKSEMTHKNPTLRSSSVVSSAPAGAVKRPTKPTKPASLMGKKPAKFALEANKWIIEFHENEPSLVVEDGQISQTVNLFGLKNSTVIVKGKVNAVSLVNCTKTSVLIESVISSVSVTKSPSFAIQVTGSVPTIQLDSTDSGQIYLSKNCLGVEITTAKCSSINVSLPVEGEEQGVFEEQAMPEMLKTVIRNGKLVTTIVEHAG